MPRRRLALGPTAVLPPGRARVTVPALFLFSGQSPNHDADRGIAFVTVARIASLDALDAATARLEARLAEREREIRAERRA